MTTRQVATASEQHHHTFKIKYRLVDDKLVIHPVCQCARCEVKAVIKHDGQGIQVTFVGSGTQKSYTAVLMEQP